MPIVTASLDDLSSATPERTEELRRLAAAADAAPEDPEHDATTAEFWKNAVLTPPPEGDNKVQVSLRVDADVLEWFKAQGKGYTTRMADTLRYFRDHAPR